MNPKETVATEDDAGLHAMSMLKATVFFDILDGAGIHPTMRGEFLHTMTEGSRFAKEFRFQGDLGFGGKAHFDGQRAYVSCYPEDDTPERDEIKRTVNEKLKALFA